MEQPSPFTPTEEQKKSADAYIDKWKPLLFLHEWSIDREYSESECREQPDCHAEIAADTTYKRATILFYPKFFNQSADIAEHAIVHELCHCITGIVKDPAYLALVREKHVMWHTFKEADERCTQQFANAIFELYRQRATIE